MVNTPTSKVDNSTFALRLGAALVGSNPGGGRFEGIAEGFFLLGTTEPLWGSSKEGQMRE